MSLTTYAFRLQPGDDLKAQLSEYCKRQNLHAATLISCVGSLKKAQLRLADAKTHTQLQGPFEIVSMTGTLSQHGLHLHISLADSTGEVVGGHLLEGCEIHTTAEIVLLESTHLIFTRESDPQTGYQELKVSPRA